MVIFTIGLVLCLGTQDVRTQRIQLQNLTAERFLALHREKIDRIAPDIQWVIKKNLNPDESKTIVIVESAHRSFFVRGNSKIVEELAVLIPAFDVKPKEINLEIEIARKSWDTRRSYKLSVENGEIFKLTAPSVDAMFEICCRILPDGNINMKINLKDEKTSSSMNSNTGNGNLVSTFEPNTIGTDLAFSVRPTWN
jgi:hypothetical protein